VHEHIGGLDVAVKDPARVQKVGGRQELKQPQVDLLFGEDPSFPPRAVDELRQVASVAILHDDDELAARDDEGFLEADEVRVAAIAADVRHRAHFPRTVLLLRLCHVLDLHVLGTELLLRVFMDDKGRVAKASLAEALRRQMVRASRL
jgi:hypothetical protein